MLQWGQRQPTPVLPVLLPEGRHRCAVIRMNFLQDGQGGSSSRDTLIFCLQCL